MQVLKNLENKHNINMDHIDRQAFIQKKISLNSKTTRRGVHAADPGTRPEEAPKAPRKALLFEFETPSGEAGDNAGLERGESRAVDESQVGGKTQ